MPPSGRYLLGELIKLKLDRFELMGDRLEFTAEVSDFVQCVLALVCHTAWYGRSRLPDRERRPAVGHLTQRTRAAGSMREGNRTSGRDTALAAIVQLKFNISGISQTLASGRRRISTACRNLYRISAQLRPLNLRPRPRPQSRHSR